VIVIFMFWWNVQMTVYFPFTVSFFLNVKSEVAGSDWNFFTPFGRFVSFTSCVFPFAARHFQTMVVFGRTFSGVGAK
jgi:hypothetical protein